MQTTTQEIRIASIDLLTDVGGPFEAVTARPYISPIVPTDLTTFAEMDAVKATFTGSAGILIVWSNEMVAPNRQVYKQSQNLNWICTATPAEPETVYGVFYYNGTDLIGVDVFPTPILVDEILDPVNWIATVP